ncbi:MAG: phosphoribosylglycinamide formyltransferase [Frankiales bacterium]|nr:phosphoribosylglycinamide formyltransferase [Frankiales bacterium]
MKRAADAGVPTFSVALADYPDRAAWDEALATAIAEFDPQLVVLAGFMRVIAAGTVARYRTINTHPSLLPSFPGAHALADALAAGVRVSGVTVHWVDAGLDSGPIIAQAPVQVLADDTEDTLRERVQTIEKPLYVSTIRQLCHSLEERTS